MPIDPLGIEPNVAVADPLGIETKGVDPLGIERPAQKLGMSATPVSVGPDFTAGEPNGVPDFGGVFHDIGKGLEHFGAGVGRSLRDLLSPNYWATQGPYGTKEPQFGKHFVIDIGPGVKTLENVPNPDPIQPGRSLVFPESTTVGDNKLAQIGYGLTTPGNVVLGAALPGEGPLSVAAKTLFGAQGAVGVAQDIPRHFNPATREEATTAFPMDLMMFLGGAHGLMPRGTEGMTRSRALEFSRDAQIETGGKPDHFNIEKKEQTYDKESQAGVSVGQQEVGPESGDVPNQGGGTTEGKAGGVLQAQRQLTPEEGVNLQHEMKGLAQGVIYAKYLGKDVQAVVDAADATWAKAHQTGDYQGALTEIAGLKRQLSGVKVAKEKGAAPTPTSAITPGFEAEQGPSAFPAGTVEGRKYPAISKEEVSALETGLEEPVPDGQSDYSRYAEVQSRMKQLAKDKMAGGDEFQKLWKESEGIKNRNKGMPPEATTLEKGVEEPVVGYTIRRDKGELFVDLIRTEKPGELDQELVKLENKARQEGLTKLTGNVKGDARRRLFEGKGFRVVGQFQDVFRMEKLVAFSSSESPAYRRFDVRTPEGKKMVELRGTQDLLKDLGIEPGVAKWGGERAANQGPQAYTAFNKLSVEQLYDKWDLVKKAKEQADKDWRQTAKAEHPDVGGDATKMADANAKHDFVEAAYKELQRRFDQKGVETGFDREAARLERMKKADEKISPEAPLLVLSPEDSNSYEALQLSSPGSMHDVVSRMAESDEFSLQERALATYLRDNFEHVLRTASVKPQGFNEKGRGGAFYRGITHEVNLAVGQKQTGSITFKVLEEGTHAALTWQLEHPVTATQKAAVASLKSIMERTKEQLPEDVKFLLSPEGRRMKGEPTGGLAYRYNNLHEFVAGLISDPELQVHLNNIQLEGIPLWKKVWHALLDLLDIKPDSALDHALQELTKVGAERGEGWAESVKDYHAANYEGASTPALRSAGMMDQLTREAPAPGSSTVVDKRLKDEFMQRYNAARGWSAPRHATANEEVANKLVRYASARQAAPEIAKWMATDVLGDKWQDPAFDNRLGAVLVEDRLRATEKSFRDMAAKATDPVERAELLAKADKVAHIFAPGEMAKELADPEIAAAIERHKATVQPMAQLQHEKLGGRLAAMGESTDAFVNLISMLSPDDVESAQSMIFGSRKGELTNPMKRGSVFNKPTKGSAPNYDLSYRKISERMIRGNYEQVALRDYYKAMIDAGLAVEEKPGVLPTTAKGGKLSPVTIETRGSGPGMTRVRKLWVRPDLKPELMQAMATDQPFRSGAVRLILDAITEVQVQGPTDALYHSANMLAVLAGSQGSKSWLYDVLRKGTPVGFLDSTIRIGYNAVKAYHDAPETQHLWAEISRIGAGREKPVHETMITKGLTKIGVPEKAAKAVQPSTWSSALIRVIDKGGRMAAAKMYDNLVERGLAKASELDKREFINRMGQYNSRLMTKMESSLRELSLSSFVVAGKNMNRQAMRRLLTNPGFRAANPAAAAKLRVTEALTLISMLAAVPAIVNSLTTGSWKGRPGTPFGAIDTGQDDKATGRPKIIDPLQLLLLRRAMRMTGMEAYRRAQGQGLNAKDTAHEMVKDAIGAYIHPWMGPGARFVMTAASGREPAVPMNEGYLLSKNPNSFAANAWAAAKNMNPTIAQMVKGHEEGTGVAQTPLQSAKAAFGFKLGRNPSWEERQTALTSKLYPGRQWEQLNVGEKRAVQDQLNKQRDEQPSSRTELGRLAAGEKSYWEQAQRDQDLKASLPKHQQKWLDQQGLHLAGFGTEVTLGKVRLPSTPGEKEALMKAMTANYIEAVKSLMGETWFNELDKGKKQEVLDKVLTRARKPVLGRFKGGEVR